MRYIHSRDDQRDIEIADRRVRAGVPSYASLLRQELTARAVARAEAEGVLYVSSTGQTRAVLFRSAEVESHGNFFPVSYRRILRNPEWARRLDKSHTTARRFLVSHDPDHRELDAATSSDALLMSLFCHPQAFAASSRLRKLVNVDRLEELDFGYKPRVPWDTQHVERTEVDLRIADDGGELLLEAKLTGADFQTIARSRLLRYLGASTREGGTDAAFDIERLPAVEGGAPARLRHGQLLRGVLSAHAVPGRRYGLICDARRPDLIEGWYEVLRAVISSELRSRLLLLTWQEIVSALPQTAQHWASRKYGILTAG